MNEFDKLCNRVDAQIEMELRKKGENFLPGNPEFDAISIMIEENRISRDKYEAAMDSRIKLGDI